MNQSFQEVMRICLNAKEEKRKRSKNSLSISTLAKQKKRQKKKKENTNQITCRGKKFRYCKEKQRNN